MKALKEWDPEKKVFVEVENDGESKVPVI